MALTRAERVDRLRKVAMFAALDEGGLDALMAALRWRDLKPGDVLYRQGEPGESMAFVVEGSLGARAKLDRGVEIEIERVPRGGVVGEMVAIDPAPRSATVVAREPTLVAELDRDALRALRAAPRVYGLIVQQTIRVVAFRLREINQRIDQELGGALSEEQAPASNPFAPPTPSTPSASAAALPGREGLRKLLDQLLGRR